MTITTATTPQNSRNTNFDAKWNAAMGLQIALRREDLGLTQRKLARRAGIHVGTLRDYERGFSQPRSHFLFRLATALGCSMDFFYTEVRFEE